MRYVNKDISNPLLQDTISRLNQSRTYNDDPNIYVNLRKLYGACCAYCESQYDDVAYSQLDHFYPKSKKEYKIFSKEVRNLHYACPRCNNLKGNKVNEIFSPNWYLNAENEWTSTNPRKIESELYYVGHLLYSRNAIEGSTDRGQNTIELFNLNNGKYTIRGHRAYLVENRLRGLYNAYALIKNITNLLKNYSVNIDSTILNLLQQLIKMTTYEAEYSTMILHNYGDLIIKLLKIYKKKKEQHKNYIL